MGKRRTRHCQSTRGASAHTFGHVPGANGATRRAGAALRLLSSKSEKIEGLCAISSCRVRRLAEALFLTPTLELREELLAVHGIGPETADSILLYAGNHPVFVVDAYTHRIFGRHGITNGKADYESVRALVETSIPRRPELFNELHALIVNTGKNWCRKGAPRCEDCPLRPLLPANSPLSTFTGIVPAGTPLSGGMP